MDKGERTAIQTEEQLVEEQVQWKFYENSNLAVENQKKYEELMDDCLDKIPPTNWIIYR